MLLNRVFIFVEQPSIDSLQNCTVNTTDGNATTSSKLDDIARQCAMSMTNTLNDDNGDDSTYN